MSRNRRVFQVEKCCSLSYNKYYCSSNGNKNGKSWSSKRFIRAKELLKIIPYSRGRIYGMIKEGTFPAPVKMGVKATAWLESEILAWQRAAIERRDGKARNE